MSDTNIKVLIPVTQGTNSAAYPPIQLNMLVELDGDDIIITRLGELEAYARFSKRDLDDALRALNIGVKPPAVYRNASQVD